MEVEKSWEKPIEEKSLNVGLCREDVISQSSWTFVINRVASRLR